MKIVKYVALYTALTVFKDGLIPSMGFTISLAGGDDRVYVKGCIVVMLVCLIHHFEVVPQV